LCQKLYVYIYLCASPRLFLALARLDHTIKKPNFPRWMPPCGHPTQQGGLCKQTGKYGFARHVCNDSPTCL